MKIRLIITVQSPLAVGGRKPGGQFQRSLEYIPGAVIRGGLAQAMIRAGLLDTHLFARLFTAEQPAVFTNAYPQHWESGFEETRVLPVTAMSCKTHRGFETEDRDKHGVFDTLIDRLCWEQLQPAALLYSPNCPQAGCGGLADRFEGFYSTSYDNYRQLKVQQKLLTRVALNRRRGVAEDQLLYSPSVLSEALRRIEDGEPRYHPSVFVAYIEADFTPDEVVGVTQLLGAIRYLGGGGSRGLGAVSIKAGVTEETGATIEARADAFNKAVRKRWGQYEQLRPQNPTPSCTPERGLFFTVGLQADVILKTPEGLPTMVFDEVLLEEAVGLKAKLVRSYAAYEYRGGWNTAWGLPKDTEVVARMGSVYLFWVEEKGWDGNALVRSEAEGIGEGRASGFGRVRICDGFHTIFREERR